MNKAQLDGIRIRHKLSGVSIAVLDGADIHCLASGMATQTPSTALTIDHRLQFASLSKMIASAVTLSFLAERRISVDAKVNELLAHLHPEGLIKGAYAGEVTLRHLLNHTALGMHYVKGFKRQDEFPSVLELLQGRHGYEPLTASRPPGTVFSYSGGGFLVLEYVLCSLSGMSLEETIEPYLQRWGIEEQVFARPLKVGSQDQRLAHGVLDDGSEVADGCLNFPYFAAGAVGTPRCFLSFAKTLMNALDEHSDEQNLALQMVQACDRGSQAFMGADMGLGVFVAQSGANRVILHQGANDGFRALFMASIEGPNKGQGFGIFANAHDRGVPMIAEIARSLICELSWQGFDLKAAEKLHAEAHFDGTRFKSEELVNQGYKALILDCFKGA